MRNRLTDGCRLYAITYKIFVRHTKRHWWDETTKSNLVRYSHIDENASHLIIAVIK